MATENSIETNSMSKWVTWIMGGMMTLALGVSIYMSGRIDRTQEAIASQGQKIAETYATKSDLTCAVDRIGDSVNRIETKVDKILEAHAASKMR